MGPSPPGYRGAQRSLAPTGLQAKEGSEATSVDTTPSRKKWLQLPVCAGPQGARSVSPSLQRGCRSGALPIPCQIRKKAVVFLKKLNPPHKTLPKLVRGKGELKL